MLLQWGKKHNRLVPHEVPLPLLSWGHIVELAFRFPEHLTKRPMVSPGHRPQKNDC